MDRPVLLFNHTHTPASNRFEREVRGLPIDSHAADYVAVAERCPPDLHPVFVKTDHWITDPTYFEDLEARLAERGVELQPFDAHVCFEIGGSRATIINGVEASVRSERRHVTIGGLPITDQEQYHNLTVDELVDVGTRAGWISPAHIGMPRHRIGAALMDAIVDRATAADVPIAVGYSAGYFPTYNRLARNELPFRRSVWDYHREYGLSLLPELDLHGVLPNGCSGCGVLDPAVTGALWDGRLPVDRLLGADLLQLVGGRNGVTVREFLRNYAVFLPIVHEPADPAAWFVRSLPETAWLQSLDIEANTVELP